MDKIYLDKELIYELHTEDLEESLWLEFSGQPGVEFHYIDNENDILSGTFGPAIKIDKLISYLQKIKEEGSKYVEIGKDYEISDSYVLAGFDIREASQEQIDEILNRRKKAKLMVLKTEKKRAQKLLSTVDEDIQKLEEELNLNKKK